MYHAHDGLPGLGPTWRSTLLGTPVDSGTHLHVNRTLVGAVGALIARAGPDVALLQEVPPWAVARIAALAGMAEVHALTAPRIGPAWLRAPVGRTSPDLVRTHEGNANAVLVRAPWAIVPGSVRRVRLAPCGVVRRVARARRIGLRATVDWAWERRGLVTARIRHPDGLLLQVGSLHCHTDRRVNDVEAGRAGRAAAHLAGELPVLLGGDLNARLGRDAAAFAALAAAGLTPVTASGAPDGGLGIDHVLVRGLEAVGPARRWRPEEREVTVPWRGGTRRIRVSDHDPVEAAVRLPVRGS
ncbi:MAG: endonuclease/exonuclease/phosphatase family protein [Actinomycetota bacterium]